LFVAVTGDHCVVDPGCSTLWLVTSTMAPHDRTEKPHERHRFGTGSGSLVCTALARGLAILQRVVRYEPPCAEKCNQAADDDRPSAGVLNHILSLLPERMIEHFGVVSDLERRRARTAFVGQARELQQVVAEWQGHRARGLRAERNAFLLVELDVRRDVGSDDHARPPSAWVCRRRRQPREILFRCWRWRQRFDASLQRHDEGE